MTSLSDLASRVERLTGPCRETDGDIANALALHPEGWQLGGKCDTEDGPYAFFLQRIETSSGKGE